MVALEVLDETELRYHAYGVSLASCKCFARVVATG